MQKSERRRLMPWALTLLALLLITVGIGVVVDPQNAERLFNWETKPTKQETKPTEQETKSSEQETKSSEQETKPTEQETKSSEQVVPLPRTETGRPGTVSDTPRPVVGRTPAPKVRGRGTLELRVYPFATVFVDGLNQGHTPMKPLQLPAGLHTVKFVHPDRTIEREVDVNAGQDILLKIDMFKD